MLSTAALRIVEVLNSKGWLVFRHIFRSQPQFSLKKPPKFFISVRLSRVRISTRVQARKGDVLNVAAVCGLAPRAGQVCLCTYGLLLNDLPNS